MNNNTVCRICKTEGVRLHCITDTYLHEMYENERNIKCTTDERKPMLACISCCDRLQNTYQLKQGDKPSATPSSIKRSVKMEPGLLDLVKVKSEIITDPQNEVEDELVTSMKISNSSVDQLVIVKVESLSGMESNITYSIKNHQNKLENGTIGSSLGSLPHLQSSVLTDGVSDHSPPTLNINKDYDSNSISNIEGTLNKIETRADVTVETESRNLSPTETLSGKRKRNPNLWKDRKNKVFKNSGQRYESIRSNKGRQGTSIGEACECKLKCYENIDKNTRKNIFLQFWALGDHERQWEFIINHVKKDYIKRITLLRKNNRNQTFTYHLTNNDGTIIKICKTMFLNTLSITQQVVYTAMEKLSADNYLKDNRGKHNNRPNKMSEQTEKSIIDHINLFERVETHYVRKDSQKEYLNETLNISKMHRLYLEWIDTQHNNKMITRPTKRQYEYIFNTKFNLSFHKPDKDQCEICSIYQLADNIRKQQLQKDYEKHIKEKEMVRELQAQEKETFDKKDSVMACFDLEKVLSIPQSEVGILHYKRKYPIYNFTVYNILEKKSYCFVWHCQIAKRGAIEIASCLWSFIQVQVEKGIKNISFYSDSCTCQNSNRFVFAMFALASKKFGIKIIHRFLERGHSQSEVDSMDAAIERAKKRQTIYTPDQMYYLIENAKVPGHKHTVKQMVQQEFIDFKKLIKGKSWFKDVNGNKIYWSKVKEVIFSCEHPYSIYFKYSLADESIEMQLATRTKSRKRGGKQLIDDIENLKPAYSEKLPVPLPLYRDLMSLCNTNAIPSHYHSFYNNLVPSENSTLVNNDSDQED